MQNSGLVNIQSHCLTHTWYFQSPEIVDFHHPGDSYPWLAWNKYPERKYLWSRESQEEFVEFGAPVYSYGRALAFPQYIEDESLKNALQEYVIKRGRASFFASSGWRDELFVVANNYTKQNRLVARYETQEEYEARVEKELRLSKQLIEANLGNKVGFLCWPGGACNQTTQRIAEEAGYLATTKGSSRNTWGADSRRIHRIGGRTNLANGSLVDRYTSLLLFAAQVQSYQGNPIYSALLHSSFKVVHTGRWLRRHWPHRLAQKESRAK